VVVARASEILALRRSLTMALAYRLHREWHIPADALIRPLHDRVE
jgi:HTH-type transcriptional regulator/antitoxin HigA